MPVNSLTKRFASQIFPRCTEKFEFDAKSDPRPKTKRFHQCAGELPPPRHEAQDQAGDFAIHCERYSAVSVCASKESNGETRRKSSPLISRGEAGMANDPKFQSSPVQEVSFRCMADRACACVIRAALHGWLLCAPPHVPHFYSFEGLVHQMGAQESMTSD